MGFTDSYAFWSRLERLVYRATSLHALVMRDPNPARKPRELAELAEEYSLLMEQQVRISGEVLTKADSGVREWETKP